MLVYFVAIWSIFLPFGTFYGHLVCCTKKNLATLIVKKSSSSKKLLSGHGLVVSSPPATKEIGAMGREIESHQGTYV
jgi:hypothetical protein